MAVTCFLALALFLQGAVGLYSSDYYTAAVFEHVKHDNPADRLGAIISNLDEFEGAAREAHLKGADIIVFPEDAIMPSTDMTRLLLEEYYEDVPNPTRSPGFNPCHQRSTATSPSVIVRLSCIARDVGIYIAANVGEKETCSPLNDTRCLPDVQKLFYNTDVVFDSNGTLIARHRKRFPFFEDNITRPKLPEYTVFNTSFGSFGVIICFDSVFVEAVDLVEKFKIENLIISTMWFDELPFVSAIQYFQAWALGNRVNVLAANLHQPITGTIGSSIISGIVGTLDYTFKPERLKSELLVARVPRNDGSRYHVSLDKGPLNQADYQHMNTDLSNYTLVQLEKVSDSVEACNNGLCCHLNYTTKAAPHDLYMGAFNGIRNIMNHYYFCQEVCLLVVCEKGTGCTRFPTSSDVLFDRVSLTGNISTPHQYPSILGSDMTIVSKHKWNFSRGLIAFESGKVDIPLLSVSIHGRCYDRDPPFPGA